MPPVLWQKRRNRSSKLNVRFTTLAQERCPGLLVHPSKRFAEGMDVNETRKDEKVPPPVISAPPEKELEDKLKQHPECEHAKVDVGSDESMDASDPPSAAQPGGGEPVPSSGFPDEK